MINLPLLTKKDLLIYKNKKIFIYGLRHCPFVVYKTLKSLGIEVIGYSIYELEFQPSTKRRFKESVRGLYYVKPERLEKYFRNYILDDIIVLPIAGSPEGIEEIKSNLKLYNLNFSPFLIGELVLSFSHVSALIALKSPLQFFWKKIKFKKTRIPTHLRLLWDDFCKCTNRDNNIVVICSPQKTADHTLNYTFNQCTKHLFPSNDNVFGVVNLWHVPSCINRVCAENAYKRFKVIMGVREPISQNLSALYEDIGACISIEKLFYSELFEVTSPLSFDELILTYKKTFENGIDVQQCWNIYTNLYLNAKPSKAYHVGSIQDFIPEFAKYVLDITNYPFNKEEGYTIIRDGNTEVFIYQLEKLNSLVPELSKWIGIPFNKLENSNQASDKWIAESYKQAQKEIEISQEYFDKCFDEPYVKHCYSEADIEKFKARWRPHIKKEA